MVKYASTFLCHSSSQKPLVERVAECLQRLGVIAWLDRTNLSVGANLSESLRLATAAQVTVTAFLSEQAMESPWVQEELEPRLVDEPTGGDAIVPVYLGDPLRLVQMSRLLSERWLSLGGGLRRIQSRPDPRSTAPGAAPSVVAGAAGY